MKTIHRPCDRLCRLLPLLMAAALFSSILLSCEEEEDNNKTPSNPTTPTTPTTPPKGDWIDVPAKGGTINKGDLTIKFPSGTFDGATQVAVTEVSASGVTEGAVSKFYQVKLKGNSLKEFDVTVTCPTDEQTRMVIQTEGFSIHDATTGKFSCPVETSLAAGFATTTIPVLTGGDGQYPEFVVGAAKMAISEDNTSAGSNNGMMMMPRILEKGVKVTWPGHDDEQSKKMVELIKQKAETANQQLIALGFNRPSGKIPYVLETYNERTWGDHVQSKYCDAWNHIRLNVILFKNILTAKQEDINECEQTLVHETSHYYDSKMYDLRIAFAKNGLGLLGDEWAMFSEAVGCWVEKMAGEKKIGMNATVNAKHFLKNFYPLDMKTEWQQVGYGMALFLEHMARLKGDKEIVKMLEYHRNGLSLTPTTERASTLDEAYRLWFKNHDVDLHEYKAYKDFIFEVLSGTFDSRADYTNIGEIKTISSEDPIRFQEDIQPLGCMVNYIVFNKNGFVDANGNKSLVDKQLNIIQNGEEGVYSDVFVIDNNGKAQWYSFSEKDVACSFDIDRTRGCYIVTTCTSRTSACKGDLTVQVGDRSQLTVNPEELTFGPEGGIQTLTVTTDQPRFAVRANDDWLDVEAFDGGVVEVYAKPNSTDNQREGSITVFARDKNGVNLTQREVKVTQTGSSQIQACSVVFELYLDYERITYNGQTEPEKGTYKDKYHYEFDQREVTYSGTGVTVHGHYETDRYTQDIDVIIPYLTGEVSSIALKRVVEWEDINGDKTRKYESHGGLIISAKNLNHTNGLIWSSNSDDDDNFDLDFQETSESWFTTLETGKKDNYRYSNLEINKSRPFRATINLEYNMY